MNLSLGSFNFFSSSWVTPILDWFRQDKENRVLTATLGLSLVLHILFLGTLSYRNVKYHRKLQKNLEVVYQVLKKQPPPQSSASKDYRLVKKQEWTPTIKAVADNKGLATTVLPAINKSIEQPLPRKQDLARLDSLQKQTPKVSGAEQKRNVSVPLLDSEKISNPKYVSYHDRIRNKIRNRAYLYVDDPAFENGSVYLTFVVGADGEVTAVRLVEERTTANDYLRNAGLRSIKESSPFPPFPKDLPYPELTFNVIISFETGE